MPPGGSRVNWLGPTQFSRNHEMTQLRDAQQAKLYSIFSTILQCSFLHSVKIWLSSYQVMSLTEKCHCPLPRGAFQL